MVLVCLPRRSGHYQIEDDDGRLLLGPFFSTPNSGALAQHLADDMQRSVRVTGSVVSHPGWSFVVYPVKPR
jgi:hypothetical protein